MLVYLICGVPGSGKTWVCDHFLERYVPHDSHPDQTALINSATAVAKHLDRPIILDCPFAERELRTRLEAAGFTVKPYFIVESTEVVQERYQKREGRPLPKPSVTRSKTIMNKVKEWEAPFGTSAEVLEMLKKELSK